MTQVISKFNSYIDNAEFNRYGIMAMTLTAGSCLGSVAAMMVLQNDSPVWQLAVVSVSTILANSIAIAQAPFRWIIWSFIAGVVINTLMILVNLG